MNNVYMGIDPGSKGFISILKQENGNKTFEFFPIADFDFYELSEVIKAIKERYPNIVCILEEVHAIHNSSAKATFSFGEINGILKGLLMANKIPYHLVPPKTWQKEMWDNKDLVVSYKTIKVKGKDVSKKEINTKQTSINAAKRIFPHIDLRKTERCKNYDDNKVDSILIAEYGRRKNL